MAFLDHKENGGYDAFRKYRHVRPYTAGTSGLIKLKITPHKIYDSHLF